MKQKAQLQKYKPISVDDIRIKPLNWKKQINEVFGDIPYQLSYKNPDGTYKYKKQFISDNENSLFLSSKDGYGEHLSYKVRRAPVFLQYKLEQRMISLAKIIIISDIIKRKNLKTLEEKIKMFSKLKQAFLNFKLEVNHINNNIWDNNIDNLELISQKNHNLKHNKILRDLENI